ncbi:hypothetical protein BDQ17DRAFT_1210475, partial [Cyathus striatus]
TDVLALTSIEEARKLYTTLIPAEKAVLTDFWNNYTDKGQLFGLKATLAIYIASNFTKIPREFQLKATIALCSRKDVLVDAGTGQGKTLCMILPALLSKNRISLVISPLKKL